MSLSTHVLDTERGTPARGVPVSLLRREGSELVMVSAAETDDDGRIRELGGALLQGGSYRLAFDVAAYFRRHGLEETFLTGVAVEFHVADTQAHYHVPLLLSRYSCTTYRGT